MCHNHPNHYVYQSQVIKKADVMIQNGTHIHAVAF